MTVRKFLRPQCHEFDGHFHYVRDGLTPYYALDRTRKDHNWVRDGKPTGEFKQAGEKWATCLDFDNQPIVPWSDPSYKLQNAYLYRIYFVCHDSTFDDERADRSKRVKGGTITIKPRWPDMKQRKEAEGDGEKEWTGEITDVNGYMELGHPYLDARVQASNIDFSRYPGLIADALASFGIPRRYWMSDNINDSSNINDAAVYARLLKDASGPIYATDGPLSRMHNVLVGDRSGYRKHVEDHRERPGDYVSTVVSDTRATKVIPGHRYGKELKHYYMRNPDNYDPDEFGYHPKLECGYQTSQTEDTIYWSDLEKLQRELEELLINTLEWAGFDVTGGEQYHDDAYFKADGRQRRTLKMVDCPLPKIESEQEATIMRLWGDMNPSDESLVRLMATDGGEISPQQAAEKTGYCYDTVLQAVDRLEGFIRHTYGSLEIESDYAAQEMLKRVRASEERFRREVGSTIMQVADDAAGKATSTLEKFCQNYDAGVQRARDDCRALIKPRITATDREDAKNIARRAYIAACDHWGTYRGVHIKIDLADGTTVHWTDLKNTSKSGHAWDETEHRKKCSARERIRQEREQMEPWERASKTRR